MTDWWKWEYIPWDVKRKYTADELKTVEERTYELKHMPENRDFCHVLSPLDSALRKVNYAAGVLHEYNSLLFFMRSKQRDDGK